MALDLANHERMAQAAIKHFWSGRASASERQSQAGVVDQGERSSVTSGKHMDGFLDLVEAIVHRNGLPNAKIRQQRGLLTLPGYFRPTKMWDVIVIDRGQLVAALELKSQVGPSFGNNFNNRTEEAVGTAHDLWTAFREGALGDQPRPFVGWLMLVEDCKASNTPVKDKSPNFPVFPEFQGASYAARYEILCRRLVQENLYTQAALMLSERTAVASGKYRELSTMTSLNSFVAGLAGHVAAFAAMS